MKRSAIITALVLAAVDAGAQTGSIDIAAARMYFNDLRALGALDNSSLWGRRIDGPMMLVDAEARVIVANEPDARGLLHGQDGVWVGKLQPELNPANTAIEFGAKRWSMILWPVSDNRYQRQRLLMHESFHRVQNELGLPMTNPSNVHLSTAEGRIWTRLEWRALTEALLRSGRERKQALADALTFRARRRTLATNAAEEERLLEMNEGLAEYTGLKLSGLPRGALNDRAAVQLAQAEPQESFVRSFAYASGPAYALLLDETGAKWRRTLRSSDDLSEIARRAFGITSILPANADSLIQRYEGGRMIADERARETRRAAKEAEIRSMFLDRPHLRLPVAAAFSFSFDPNGAVPLVGVGTFYESSRISDTWGVLEVASGGVLLETRADGAITGVIVSKPIVSEGMVSGVGWKLTLSPGWSVVQGASANELVVRSP